MRTKSAIRRALAALWRGPSRKDIAMQKREMERQLQARGLSRAEARRTTVKHFNNPATKEAKGDES